MISNEKEFWTVGFSAWGRWQVRKASVDDPYTYTLIEDLGPELKAAYLEADGNFIYVPGQEHMTLITDSVPWLVVITTSGKLYVKKVAEPLENVVLLDTGVEEACVCRGWKSEHYSVDAGLIVAYRKQVGAYLRAYLPIQGMYTWDGVETLSSAAVNHIEIKRLNDFRIGILLDNQLLISDRYYIGGTAKTEMLGVDTNLEFSVASFCEIDGPHDDIRIVNVELKDYIEYWVTANYPFYSRDDTWDDISITTTVPSGQGIDSWWIENGYLKIRMKQQMRSAYTYMSFQIRAVNRLRVERTPQSRPICPQLDIIYQAPPFYQEPEHLHPVISLTSTFVLKERRDLKYSCDEILAVEPIVEVTFSNPEVQRKSHRQIGEALYPDITVACMFNIEMVGDKPI